MKTSPIAVTLGEPAGIGVDLLLQYACENSIQDLTVIADENLLNHRAEQLKIKNNIRKENLIHVKAANYQCCAQPDINNAEYILKTIDIAIEGCLDKTFSALVTGPVQKSLINDAGFHFTGHTEYLAQKSKTKKTVMCFDNQCLRIALATTHVPLAKVAQLITEELLIEVITIVHKELKKKFHKENPIIAVCGLNPHAGEQGHLGTEEQDVIIPALEKLQSKGIQCIGPLPADTVFLQKNVDCILAMYHDQLLPAIKYQHFFDTVNVTLGLPFVRTSVDHGTALDLAGSGKTTPESLFHTIQLARKLSA